MGSDCPCGFVGNDATKIFGGIAANANELPWQVGLIMDGVALPICGGTLISDVYVLTAAHCTYQMDIAKIRVLLGETDVTSANGIRAEILSKMEHPNYQHGTSFYDFSLLRLKNPISFSAAVLPACLPANDAGLFVDARATASGWGRTQFDRPQSNVLLKIDNLRVIENSVCQQTFNFVSSPMLCATDQDKDTCQGDSGGPLVTEVNGRWTVIGVVSGGSQISCSPGATSPGVYSRVTSALDWIRAMTANGGNCNIA